MKKIIIQDQQEKKNSTIFIDTGLLEKIGKIQNLARFSNVFVITDKNIESLLLQELTAHLPISVSHIALQPGENAKNIESIEKIWGAMRQSSSNRKTLVINLGGGAISDMGGFAASTYMRGVDFINIPTTLLAQVDASIGGKTAIDFTGIKNLIGTFALPLAVVIDPTILKTLPRREFISGFGEIIKHGLITNKKHFLQATAKKPQQFTQKELLEIITKSCEIKANVVTEDRTESNRRKILNFGHTIGHAIEALSLTTKHPLLHGEAISIGMVAEAKISQLLGMLSESEYKKICNALLYAELPISFTDIDTSDILEKIKFDKKNLGNLVNFTLLQGIGNAVINQHVPQDVLIEALQLITK